jgi:glycosyltransferase involved in cell wall biosynthesis
MKVLVVDTFVPFAPGCAGDLASDLVGNLQRTAGTSAELLRIPVSGQADGPPAEEIMLCRLMELHWVDRVIGLRFPAYLIPHGQKTLWLQDRVQDDAEIHNDDTSDADDAVSPTGTRALAVRDMARHADDACLSAAMAIFVNNPKARDRLRSARGFDAAVLPPPLVDPQRFVNRGTGDYIFVSGRIGGNHLKLLTEALKLCRSGVRLIVAGMPATEADAQALYAASADPSLQARLTLDLGGLERHRLAAYVGNALACADFAADENGAGDVAMAAFAAAKPVIATTDFGDPHALVVDRATGFVTEPRADCLADAMDGLFRDKPNAEQLGRAGQALWRERNITWRGTIERLLS